VSDYVNRVFAKSCEHMDEIPDNSIHCVVTSPPYYGLREYGIENQLGHEPTVAEYVERLVAIGREIKRVLRPDGTFWLNLGDSYAGSWGAQGHSHDPNGTSGLTSPNSERKRQRSAMADAQIAAAPHKATRTGTIQDPGMKPKDLRGVPWRVAFALQADGWYLRDAIVWAKPNPMPSSVRDRCTSSYEMVFMLAKRRTYYADMDAVREPLAESSVQRLTQAGLEAQAGSDRANGGAKTNGPMKAVYKHDCVRVTSQVSPNRVWTDADACERIITAGANLRNVWTIATTPYFGEHPAVMPRELATRCILIGTPPGGIVLDPFAGSGTVLECALGNGRNFVGYESNESYCHEMRRRLGLFGSLIQ
jgi:DNA modification methylase